MSDGSTGVLGHRFISRVFFSEGDCEHRWSTLSYCHPLSDQNVLVQATNNVEWPESEAWRRSFWSRKGHILCRVLWRCSRTRPASLVQNTCSSSTFAAICICLYSVVLNTAKDHKGPQKHRKGRQKRRKRTAKDLRNTAKDPRNVAKGLQRTSETPQRTGFLWSFAVLLRCFWGPLRSFAVFRSSFAVLCGV